MFNDPHLRPLPAAHAATAPTLPALRVGMIGLGTVGTGVWQVLRRNQALIAARAGRRIEIVSEKDARSYTRLLAEFGVEPEAFAMVGNSLRSDIEPVVRLGGWGVHVPYHLTWAHENEADDVAGHPRLRRVDTAADLPDAIRAIASAGADTTIVAVR